MSYENFLMREQNWEAPYQQGDTNCSDCNQVICACESLSEWYAERDAEVCSTGSGEVPASPEPTPLNCDRCDENGVEAYEESGGGISYRPCSHEIDYEHFGSESEPYTQQEVNVRRKETHICE